MSKVFAKFLLIFEREIVDVSTYLIKLFGYNYELNSD